MMDKFLFMEFPVLSIQRQKDWIQYMSFLQKIKIKTRDSDDNLMFLYKASLLCRNLRDDHGKNIGLKEGTEKIHIISDRDILFTKAQKDYMDLHYTRNGIEQNVRIHCKAKKISQELENLLQTHRSFIVNQNKIKTLYPEKLQLENKTEIPIGSTYRESIQEYLPLLNEQSKQNDAQTLLKYFRSNFFFAPSKISKENEEISVFQKLYYDEIVFLKRYDPIRSIIKKSDGSYSIINFPYRDFGKFLITRGFYFIDERRDLMINMLNIQLGKTSHSSIHTIIFEDDTKIDLVSEHDEKYFTSIFKKYFSHNIIT